MPEISSRVVTYCTNIHPAESWADTFTALKTHVPAIKAAVSPATPFPIGLRISARAAAELSGGGSIAFSSWLEENGCFVPTLNGFPFGSFHQQPIKEQVYLPDWRSPERAEYTVRLADLLAEWLPEDSLGSISTVPLAFKATVRNDADADTLIRRHLKEVLTHLAGVYEERGRRIVLALEPEPGCLMETTEEVCRFFERVNLPLRLRRHLGICYDCCHQAVQFEDPAASLGLLSDAGVPVAKVHVSSALAVHGAAASFLALFDEPCYLHQVVVRRRDGKLLRYNDVAEAITGHWAEDGDQWRCHFHVPIFLPQWGEAGTTQDFLEAFLHLIPHDVVLEVETYTWDVLPARLRTVPVTQSIIREILWLKERLHA